MSILCRFAADRPKITLLLILLVAAALAPGLRGLEVKSDFRGQIPKTHEIIKSTDNYEEIFGNKITEFIAVVNEKNTIYNPETFITRRKISWKPKFCLTRMKKFLKHKKN